VPETFLYKILSLVFLIPFKICKTFMCVVHALISPTKLIGGLGGGGGLALNVYVCIFLQLISVNLDVII
jgi:hypothetical protein